MSLKNIAYPQKVFKQRFNEFIFMKTRTLRLLLVRFLSIFLPLFSTLHENYYCTHKITKLLENLLSRAVVPNFFGVRTTKNMLVLREPQNIDLYWDSTWASLADHVWSAQQTLGTIVLGFSFMTKDVKTECLGQILLPAVSLGVVHKWRHAILDILWPPPPIVTFFIIHALVLFSQNLLHPSQGRDVIYGRPLNANLQFRYNNRVFSKISELYFNLCNLRCY